MFSRCFDFKKRKLQMLKKNALLHERVLMQNLEIVLLKKFHNFVSDFVLKFEKSKMFSVKEEPYACRNRWYLPQTDGISNWESI